MHNGAELECRPRDLLNASEGIFFKGVVKHNVYLRVSIWYLFFLGVVEQQYVKCASVICLGVLDHDAYCAIVVICVKSRHPQLCFRNVILVL